MILKMMMFEWECVTFVGDDLMLLQKEFRRKLGLTFGTIERLFTYNYKQVTFLFTTRPNPVNIIVSIKQMHSNFYLLDWAKIDYRLLQMIRAYLIKIGANFRYTAFMHSKLVFQIFQPSKH